jgi:hypothetical protein
VSAAGADQAEQGDAAERSHSQEDDGQQVVAAPYPDDAALSPSTSATSAWALPGGKPRVGAPPRTSGRRAMPP